MSKGRRKVRSVQEPPRSEQQEVKPPPARTPPAPPPEERRSFYQTWVFRVAALLVLAAGATFAIAKWAWPRSIEISEPAGLDYTAPEVREHVRARIARVREEPRNAERQSDLGLALAANGFWKEARQAFENASQLAPDDPLTAYYVARSASEAGDSETAKRDLEGVLKRFPKFPQAHYALGMILLESGNPDAAAERFKELLSIEGERSTWGRLGLAKVMLEQGKHEQAVALLEPVVQHEPGLAPANYLLGSAYRGLKKFDQANRYLAIGVRGSIVSMPDPWSARFGAEARTLSSRITEAQRRHAAGRTSDATTLLEQLRVNYPTDPELLSNLGGLYLESRQVEKGRAVLILSEKANPAHLPTIFNLVAAELKLGAHESALKYSRRALELAPAHYHSHLAHADVLIEMKRLGEGLEALKGAVRLDPRNASLRLRTGALLARMQRFPEAKTELDAATQIDPSNGEGWLALAEVCITLKLAHEARAALEQARRVAPRAPQIAPLARRLEALGGG